jgi:uncharacterized membrane protein YjfL (UPF0719 family)
MDSEWVGRAGILAEAVSFILIAPEILGEERLKGAEKALRSGMANATVRRTMLAAWGGLYLGLFLVVVASVYTAEALPVIILQPNVFWAVFALVFVGMFVSYFSMWVCRAVVDHRLAEEEEAKGTVLFTRQGELARASLVVLNPRAFGRIMKPSSRQWVFWAMGVPFHFMSFVGYVSLPGGLLALVHLQQRLLAGENRLRAFIFGTGVSLLLGGLAAQFYATF